MGRLAARAGVDASKFIAQVERAGRRLAVRSDLRKSKAFDWVVEHAVITDEEGNAVERALLARQGEAALAEDAAQLGAPAVAGAAAAAPLGAEAE